MLETSLLKKNLINQNFINNLERKFLDEINRSIQYAKKSKFPEKFNVRYLNNNNSSKNNKIKILEKKFSKTVLSRKKIIGY